MALRARNLSYSPYSYFKVGAALLCADGSIYTGANIENAAYSPTVCAEQTAFFKAVLDEHRKFAAIFIAGGSGEVEDFCPPCGVCRQVMREFCIDNEFKVFLVKSVDEIRKYTLSELLPLGFGSDSLKKGGVI
ncbi:MAG: cytidine deaminase [Defluviitaleaceae bacterium]|nr:cytidine deaminase [Defluviitaleaceae bacterium]